MKRVTDVNRACSRQPIITTSIPTGNYLRRIAGREVRHALDFIALEIPGAFWSVPGSSVTSEAFFSRCTSIRPLYGDGMNVRDWLDVEDHCGAILRILGAGSTGKTYNIGGMCEKTNIVVVHAVCDMSKELHPLADNDATRDQAPAIAQYRDPVKR